MATTSSPSISTLTRTSTTAAKAFVDSYYESVNKMTKRSTISNHYMPGADISLNGNIVPTVQNLQTIWDTQMPKAHHEVQSYDCHVVNPNWNMGLDEGAMDYEQKATVDPKGMKASICVLVSGYVKYGDARDAKQRGFTENFILVPDLSADARDRKWLIQSQNFRVVL